MNYIENEKGYFIKNEINHRLGITKVRGGWNKDKIKRELKNGRNKKGELVFLREIMRFDTPEEFIENMTYHGSGKYIDSLKPSIAINIRESQEALYLGGGSGERYYAISVSKDKNIASNFTGMSNYGCVAPVLLCRGTVIKNMPEIKDSNVLTDIIEDLWTEGVDAVVLNQGEGSEKEIAILNPRCIAIGKSETYRVFGKKKMPSLTKEELTEIWINSSDNYKNMSLQKWEESNKSFLNKYGSEKDPETKWPNRKEALYQYHKCNVEKYEQRQKLEQNEKKENKIKLKI